MSLFDRLLKLHNGNTPLEDFFTELVAHLFITNKGILVEVHRANGEEKVEFHQNEKPIQIQPENQEYYALAD